MKQTGTQISASKIRSYHPSPAFDDGPRHLEWKCVPGTDSCHGAGFPSFDQRLLVHGCHYRDPLLSCHYKARDRFLLLLSFFHLINNQNCILRRFPGHDPLYKLCNIFKTIVSILSSVYYPSKNLSLDEGMVPWRGNLHSRVYNSDKPTKYGIKTNILCDSDNGYCSKFQIYTGKNNSPPVFLYHLWPCDVYAAWIFWTGTCHLYG